MGAGRWLRVGAAVLILGAVLWRVGAEPFLAGLRAVGPGAVAAALALTAVGTVAAAWRWRSFAGALGLQLGPGEAVADYYRSQFLNSVLPGGVVGDVHRGLRHGKQQEALGAGLRGVAWDRLSGQTVQLAGTAAVLLAVPSAISWTSGPIALAAAVLVTVPCIALWSERRAAVHGPWIPRRAASPARHRIRRWWHAACRTVAADLRLLRHRRGAAPAVLVGSLLVAASHLGVFLVAARAVDPTLPLARLAPVALLVLVAAAIPLNAAGWGPREGIAAWAFGATGLGAANGLAAATAFGVLALLATTPGLVVVIAQARHRRPEMPVRELIPTGPRGAHG